MGGGLVFEDLKDLDVLFTWQDREQFIKSYLENVEQIVCSDMYYPYMFKNPWTEALYDKNILVVSPFAELIKNQYETRREKLFKDPKVLPKFKKLEVVKAYEVHNGRNKYSNISSWFDALNDMNSTIDKMNYDIALIGCGAYAFDIAAHVKRVGKKAITLCGSHEVLFGIYGTRYENFLKENGILNEYWVRPGDEYKPEGFEKVENGAYW